MSMIKYPLRTKYDEEQAWIEQRRREWFIKSLIFVAVAFMVVVLGILGARAI